MDTISRISLCIVLCRQNADKDKMHQLILENASTNCTVACVNKLDVGGPQSIYNENEFFFKFNWEK